MKPSKSTRLDSHASLATAFAVALFTLTANPASAAIAVTEKFTTAETFNWTCPAFVTSVQVECWGGGGAGGGSVSGTGLGNAGGGGGGGGAYAALISVPVTAGNIYTFTIPAAATCPTSGFTNTQKFDGSPVTFTGDSAITVTANGGAGGGSAVVTAATAISGAAGAGGAAGTGLSAAWKGGNATFWSSGNGGGGGGGAGDLGAGGNSDNVNASYGSGGLGSDADHTGGNGGASKNGAGTGNTASSPGGGGGGAKSTAASPTSRAGGAGGLGRVILTYTPAFPSVVKDENAFDLSGGSSWVGGLTPDSNKVAKWNSTVTSANTTALGADVTWLGIAIENPNGLVTINPGNPGKTLTLGIGGIDMTTADTADLTLNCPITLGAANIWKVSTGRTLTLGGAVSGAFRVTKQGEGKAILSIANTYTGDTIISAGTVQLGAADLIPNGAATGNVVIDGTLDLNGQPETLNGLSGNGIIDNPVAATTSTLTVGSNDQSGAFNGMLKNTGASATLNLIKTGTGTQVLGGVNTLSGGVTITGGTLAVSNIAPLANVTGITIGAGAALRPDVVNAVISSPITLGAAMTTSTIHATNVPGSGTTAMQFNLEGAISGAGNLTLNGIQPGNAYSTINLKAASNYTGSTLITCSDELGPTTPGNQNIFVRLFVNNALPVTTVLTLDGGEGAPLASAPGRYCEFNLNGNNQTLAGLENVPAGTLRVQRIVNSSATTATLTVNNALPHTYAGQLGWVSGVGSLAYNNFNLTKSGAGVQTFSGPLQYSGNTTVTGGTLSLGTVNPNNELSSVTLTAPGILQLTFAGSDTVDKLFINGIQRPMGTYGRTGTGATNGGAGEGAFDAYFAIGTGTLTVTSSTSSFASWITGTFANSATVPGDQQGPNQDPDNDGISNLVEFAIAGQDPTVPNASVGTFAANVLSFSKRVGTSGLTYAIQESTDLGISDDWTEVSGGSYVNDATTISYTLTPGTPVKNFTRLKVLSN